MIRFMHQLREVALETIAADTTILDYLREHRGLRGTKEGCASGDCGACTVVTVSAEGDNLHYEAINACIAPLGGLHGKKLITVEDLTDGETWHPVQRAMIECHASQCGFCTPGFVMSLFALYHRYHQEGFAPPNACETDGDAISANDGGNAAAIARQNVLPLILEALGGNLCRCTGYRPIIEAAQRALEADPEDKFLRRESATLDMLRALKETERDVAALTGGATHYFRPNNLHSVASLLEQYPNARLIAGGTDLMLEKTQQLKPLNTLIDIRAVVGAAVTRVDADAIRLGPATTHRQSQAALLSDYPELSELIERFGSLQIRSQGTVLGNIANASPIGDWPPVFLALGATLHIQSTAGVRDLPIDEFFIGYRQTALAPGEFLSGISLPRRPAAMHFRAYKISKRFDDDISSVCVVVALRMDGDRISEARIGCGGMAAVPQRALGCEAALPGLDLRRDTLDAAARALDEDFTPISDARASAVYRQQVAKNLLLRLQQEYCGHAVRAHHPQPVAHG